MLATPPLPGRPGRDQAPAREIGYPVMLKASWAAAAAHAPDRERGRPARRRSMAAARREAKSAFGKDEGTSRSWCAAPATWRCRSSATATATYHFFERDCSIQRRNQKVVERAPAPYLDDAARQACREAALAIGRATNYVGAGTVEFLMDADTGAFYFIGEPAHPGGAHRHRPRWSPASTS